MCTKSFIKIFHLGYIFLASGIQIANILYRAPIGRLIPHLWRRVAAPSLSPDSLEKGKIVKRYYLY